MIDVRAMRAAGLTDKQIVDTIEACQQERADRRKEQNRINKRNQRSRQQNAADSQHVSADMLTPSPPSLPLSMVSPITPSLTLPLSSPSTKRSCSNSFERFWKVYPKRVAKKAAEKALAKALRETSIDTILDAIVRQTASWTDPKFIPHPATWLNAGHWADETSQTDGVTNGQDDEFARRPGESLGDLARRMAARAREYERAQGAGRPDDLLGGYGGGGPDR